LLLPLPQPNGIVVVQELLDEEAAASVVPAEGVVFGHDRGLESLGRQTVVGRVRGELPRGGAEGGEHVGLVEGVLSPLDE